MAEGWYAVLSDLLGIKWKIGTFGFGIAAIALGVALFIYKAENKSLRNDNAIIRIDLTRAKDNVAVCEAGLADQNSAYEALAKESARRLAEAKKQLETAQKARRSAEARAAVLLSKPINGSTLEQRVLEVDKQVLESLQ